MPLLLIRFPIFLFQSSSLDALLPRQQRLGQPSALSVPGECFEGCAWSILFNLNWVLSLVTAGAQLCAALVKLFRPICVSSWVRDLRGKSYLYFKDVIITIMLR